VALRLPTAVVLALLLCGCEVYAVPDPITCPDVRQGTFNFVGNRVYQPSDCFFAQSGGQVNNPISFPGTISFLPGGNAAALCRGASHALPNVGTYSGLTIDVRLVLTLPVSGCTCPTAEAVTAGKCACPANTPLSGCQCSVDHEQRIQGTLEPIPGGYSGFTGTLVNTVIQPPGTVAADLCNCQQACSYAYDLAATVVGSH